MTDVRRLCVDSNVLLFAANDSSPWHEAACRALHDAYHGKVEVCISPQITREYLASATRIERATCGTPAFARIMENIETFKAAFEMLNETSATVDALLDIVEQVPTGGKQIHDANIVAVMRVYGIHHLLTHNERDFVRFSRWITVVPLESWKE